MSWTAISFSNSDQNLIHFYPPVLNSQPPELLDIACSEYEVLHLLSSILRKASSGPDGISNGLIWDSATSIASSLIQLFNKSLPLKQVPAD